MAERKPAKPQVAEMSQAQRDAFRDEFLLACYRKYGTRHAVEEDGGLVGVGVALAKEWHLNPSAATEAYSYWVKRGCISGTQAGGRNLTVGGRDQAEELLRERQAKRQARGVGTSTGLKKKKGEKLVGDWIRTAEQIGKGGQGGAFIAFRREDSDRQHPYILKQFWNRERIARSRREIKAALDLEHPGIVKVVGYDFGDADGSPFLVMPFYSKEHLRQGHIWGMEPVQKLRFFSKVCRAAGYAHEKGVVHRDIKPENILVADDDSPVLADFGICWLRDEEGEQRLTQTEEQVGPRFYMAPELADGRTDPSKIAPAADVYSLGKVLYWMFSDGAIFDREKHNDDEWDLRRKDASTAVKLVYHLLDRSIVDRPEGRFFQNGTQFAMNVEAYIDILTTEAHVLDLSVPQPCVYCKVGNYKVEIDPRWWENTSQRDTTARERSELLGFHFQAAGPRLVLRCPECGNLQSFQFSRDARYPMRNWKLPPTRPE